MRKHSDGIGKSKANSTSDPLVADPELDWQFWQELVDMFFVRGMVDIKSEKSDQDDDLIFFVRLEVFASISSLLLSDSVYVHICLRRRNMPRLWDCVTYLKSSRTLLIKSHGAPEIVLFVELTGVELSPCLFRLKLRPSSHRSQPDLSCRSRFLHMCGLVLL